MSDGEYEGRLGDFLKYVCSLEDGLETDCPNMDIGSVTYDTDQCPLPGSVIKEEE